MLTSAFWITLWIFSLSLLLDIFLLRWWPGDRLLIVRLINYALPWLLAVLIPALLLAGLTGRKLLFLSFFVSILFICITQLPLFIKNPPPNKGELIVLRVMSYNLWSHNQDLAATARVIEAVQPDILLLQELPRANVAPMQGLLAQLFPEEKRNFAYDPKSSLAIFSRYPLRSESIKVKGSIQKSIVETPLGAITIYNSHFLRTVLRRSNNWQKLYDQVTQVLSEEITQTAGPMILGGDFNMTDQTQTYRLLNKELKNAHGEVGRGFGFTFPSPVRRVKGFFSLPPLVRIDHLFYNNQLVALSAKTLADAGGSDHFPIVAEFTLPIR